MEKSLNAFAGTMLYPSPEAQWLGTIHTNILIMGGHSVFKIIMGIRYLKSKQGCTGTCGVSGYGCTFTVSRCVGQVA